MKHTYSLSNILCITLCYLKPDKLSLFQNLRAPQLVLSAIKHYLLHGAIMIKSCIIIMHENFHSMIKSLTCTYLRKSWSLINHTIIFMVFYCEVKFTYESTVEQYMISQHSWLKPLARLPLLLTNFHGVRWLTF